MSMAIGKARRRFLKLMGGVGLGTALGGCCSLGPTRPGINGDKYPFPTRVDPYLLPAGANHVPPEVGYPCVDVHAHFFNASDVNVKDYFEKCVLHEKVSPNAMPVVRALALVLDRIAHLAPTADAEYRYLIKRINNAWEAPAGLVASEGTQRGERGFLTSLNEEAQQQHKNITSRLHVELNSEPGFVAAYRRYQREDLGIQMQFLPGGDDTISEEEISLALDPTRRISQDNGTSSLLQGYPSGGYLEFVGHMLSYRYVNLQQYADANTREGSAFCINAVFSALVDFDYWLDCFSTSSREDQMKLHSLLSLLSGGYMLPLISYNPWTDIKQSALNGVDASLELVKTAIKEYGFIGVKIYPPVGYFPYGNSSNKIDSKEARPDLKKLDEKLGALFDWCIENDVPVMAHTNETMGRDDASDEFGGPRGWWSLLQRYSEKGQAPTINLAHFGGGAPSEGTEHNWPSIFSCYMKSIPGRNMYGDIGYWTELTSCNGSEVCDAAMKRLEAAAKIYPEVTSRIMFGSDWFMTSQVPNWPAYAHDIWRNTKDLFKEDGAFRKKLFYSNAMSCFGLYKDGAQRQRVVARFDGKGFAWLPQENAPPSNRRAESPLSECGPPDSH